MDSEALIGRLRAQHTPTKSSSVPGDFVELLKGLLDAAQIKAEVMLGGSYAKGTYLEGDHDIDVFVRFDHSYADKEMPDLLGLALGGWEGLRRVHGSRDYFQLEKGGFSFEIVPVLKVEAPGEARNVTDVSPLHVRYVRDAISKEPLIAADIRLAKLFCKAARVYGAESYIGGFSGHVLDNLIIHYGSFLSLLEAASRWPAKVFIDPLGRRKDASALSPAKRAGPLVLLDPIQPDRNAAAALTSERFEAFKDAARAFLEAPDDSFFVREPLSPETVAKDHPDDPSLCYELLPLEGSKDVVGTKLFKAHGFILRLAREAGFTLLDEGFEFDGRRAFCFLVVKERRLPSEVELQGPPLSARRDAQRFRDAHDRVQERQGRLFALEPRPVRTLKSLFSAALKDPYVKERVSGAKTI